MLVTALQWPLFHKQSDREFGEVILAIFLKSVCLLLASVLVGMFITLQMVTVNAQVLVPATGVTERVAILESRSQDNRDVIAQLRAEIVTSRASIDQDRQRIEDLQNRLSVITGIGIGLSSIMMILQLVQTISGIHVARKREDDAP